MAEYVTIPDLNGQPYKAAIDDVVINGDAVKVQRMKVGFGDDGEYHDISDDFPLPALAGNNRDFRRDGFTGKDSTAWTFPSEAPPQYAKSWIDGNVAGESYLVVSMSALVAGGDAWAALSVPTYLPPYELEFGVSLSQRVAGQEFAVEAVGLDTAGAVVTDAAPAAIAISGSITVATNVWTIATATAHGLLPGDQIALSGNTDPRLNVGPVVVTGTPSTTSLTLTSTLANATYTAGGSLIRIDMTSNARYHAGFRWFGTTAGNADVVSQNADPRARVFNLNPANTQDAASIPSEGGINYAALPFVRAFRTRGSWHLDHAPRRLLYRARDYEATGADRTSHLRRSPIPDPSRLYRLRLRSANLANLSVPTAPITAAVKLTAITTATLTVPNHGLTTSDWVVVYGIRDQTNFANATAQVQVSSVIDANTITVVVGAAAIASSYGGFVMRVQGSLVPGIENRAVQTYAATSDGLRLSLVANSNWATTIGETWTVFGLVDSTATVQTGLNGRWRVAVQTLTTIELEPMDGQSLSGVSTTPANAGGTLIKNTDLRLHYVRVSARSLMEIDDTAGGIGVEPRPAAIISQPAAVITGYPTSAASADSLANPTVTQIGALGLLYNGTTWDRARGNWNIATGDTGAKTTSGNGATQTNFNAAGAVISIIMGTVTGTTPTFTPRLQMSPDGGTSWVDILAAAWAAITASGTFTLTIFPGVTDTANVLINQPLPRTWRLAWNIAGTSPSFTLTSVQVAYIKG